jgi:hypothetical protein
MQQLVSAASFLSFTGDVESCRNFEAGRMQEFLGNLGGDSLAWGTKVPISTRLSKKSVQGQRQSAHGERKSTVNTR